MKLTQRINWLSRAVVCLRGGAGASPTTGVFLRVLEDKAEVARLQKSVLNAVRRLNNVPPTALQILETQLLDITKVCICPFIFYFYLNYVYTKYKFITH